MHLNDNIFIKQTMLMRNSTNLEDGMPLEYVRVLPYSDINK